MSSFPHSMAFSMIYAMLSIWVKLYHLWKDRHIPPHSYIAWQVIPTSHSASIFSQIDRCKLIETET